MKKLPHLFTECDGKLIINFAKPNTIVPGGLLKFAMCTHAQPQKHKKGGLENGCKCWESW